MRGADGALVTETEAIPAWDENGRVDHVAPIDLVQADSEAKRAATMTVLTLILLSNAGSAARAAVSRRTGG